MAGVFSLLVGMFVCLSVVSAAGINRRKNTDSIISQCPDNGHRSACFSDGLFSPLLYHPASRDDSSELSAMMMMFFSQSMVGVDVIALVEIIRFLIDILTYDDQVSWQSDHYEAEVNLTTLLCWGILPDFRHSFLSLSTYASISAQ